MNKKIVTALISAGIISILFPLVAMLVFGDSNAPAGQQGGSFMNRLPEYFKYVSFMFLVVFPVSVMVVFLRAKPSQ